MVLYLVFLVCCLLSIVYLLTNLVQEITWGKLYLKALRVPNVSFQADTSSLLWQRWMKWEWTKFHEKKVTLKSYEKELTIFKAITVWQRLKSVDSTTAKDIRSKNGLVKQQPALLYLPVFSQSQFYWRFGNCLLHNAVVGGNIARHIQYLGTKYGEAMIKGRPVKITIVI